MTTPLHVLLVEDNEDDANLLCWQLTHAGYKVVSLRVETLSALQKALERQAWDIILADYQLPKFNAPAALALVQAMAQDIPFIIVSGTVDDDTAVNSMRAGAHDFFAKDRTQRLPAAIDRELQAAQQRRLNREAELGAAATARRLAEVFAASPIGISITRVEDGLILEANHALCDIIHYSAQELVGHTSKELGLWADRAAFEQMALSLTPSSPVRNLGAQLRTRTGSLKDVLVTADLINYDNQPCVLAMYVDVTAERQSTRTIHQLAAIVEASDDAIIGKTLDGTIINWNTGAEHLYGYRAEEVIGKSITLLAPPDREDEIRVILDMLRRGGEVQHLETKRLCKDGRRVFVSLSVFPIIEDEQVVAAAAIARDITQRKQAEEQLAFQANLLQNVSDAIIALDSDWKVQSWNKGAEVMYGWTEDEVTGQSIGPLLQADYLDQTREAVYREFTEKGETQSEAMHVRKDGTWIRVQNRTSTLKNWAGRIIGAVAINRDVTRQRDLEAQALESARLQEALEHEIAAGQLRNRFVSMVSHEFRTPLATIQTSSDLLKYYFEKLSTERREEHLGNINVAVQRLTSLLEDVLAVERADTVGLKATRVPTDVDALLHTIRDEAQLAYGQERSIVYTAYGAVGSAHLDTRLMHQAVTNLLSNALKYSSPDSVVHLELEATPDNIVIRVKDEGIGVPEVDLTRLFEGFFRASNVGVRPGTGLGLAIVKQIAEAHDGGIRVESQEGVGSTFTLVIPHEQRVLDVT